MCISKLFCYGNKKRKKLGNCRFSMREERLTNSRDTSVTELLIVDLLVHVAIYLCLLFWDIMKNLCFFSHIQCVCLFVQFFLCVFFQVSKIKFCAHAKNKYTEPRSTATVYTGTCTASVLMKINMARCRFSPTPTKRDRCIHLCCRLVFLDVCVRLCVPRCWGQIGDTAARVCAPHCLLNVWKCMCISKVGGGLNLFLSTPVHPSPIPLPPHLIPKADRPMDA